MRRKIVISVLALFILSSLGAAAASWYVSVATNQLQNLVNLHEIEGLRQNLVISLQEVQVDVHTTHTSMARNLDGIIASVRKLDQAAAECSNCHHRPEIEVKLNKVNDLLGDYKIALSHYITASANKQRIDAIEQEAEIIGHQILVHTEGMSMSASEKLDMMTGEAITKINRVRIILFITVLFTMTLCIVVTASLVKSLTRPVERLVGATEIIASGDLSYRIEDVVDPEFQKLAEHFNTMSTTLQESYAQLEDSNAELQSQINEREELQAQLLHGQKMEAIGTLASAISHEFGNSIQIIQSCADLLGMKGNLQGTEHPELGMISDAAHRAADLSRRLLTFGSKSETQLEPTDLNGLVQRVEAILRTTISRTIDIQSTFQDQLPAVNVDPSQIELSIVNLALNAKDAMPDGGLLRIETAQVDATDVLPVRSVPALPGAWIRLSVSDNGEGMDPATVARIFDPFFTTKGLGVGTGLGLAVVYDIVKNFGGRIHCQSTLGSGTTFQIFLPALPEGSLKIEKEQKSSKLEVRSNETLLLVDDEADMVEVMGVALREQGYIVHTANSGEKAVEVFEEHGREIQVVILDIGMPGMGGQVCLEKLLTLDPKVKVIMSSAYGSQGRQNALMQLGASGFLVKPYRLADMLKEINAVSAAG